MTCPDEEEALRGGQILRWLQEHPEVEGFVVLDDDIVSLGRYARHILHTDDACGLKDGDVERAAEILSLPLPD